MDSTPKTSGPRRRLRYLLICAVLLAATFWLTGVLLGRSLDTELAGYQGPSLKFPDYVPTPLPPGTVNAWDSVEAAQLLLEGQGREADPELQAILEHFRKEARHPDAAALDRFRAALKDAEPALEVLDRAFSEATEARFLTNYEVVPMRLEIPNFIGSLRIAALLRARLEVAIADGRGEDAWREAANLYRFAYWNGTATRTLIGALVTRAISHQAAQATQTLLATTPADAATRDKVLAEARRLDPPALFADVFAAERAAMYNTLLAADFRQNDLEGLENAEDVGAQRFPLPVALLYRWQPWIRYNLAHYLRWSVEADAVCGPGSGTHADRAEQLAAIAIPSWIRPAASLTYDCIESADKRDLWKASADQQQIAFALESWRELHGSYPQTLAEAGGDLAQKTDPFSGQAYRYAPQAGGYRLYSVGANGKDDGGQSVRKPDGQLDLKQGDWVWQVGGAN